MTVAGHTVTINQGPGLATMAIDRTLLNFGAIVSPSGMSVHTAAQLVRMTQSGLPGTVTWTASSNQPWLTVAPASGSGTAVLSVGVKFDPSVESAPGKATGSITIVLSGASGPVGPVTVNLTLIPPGQSVAPFGSFDTPANGVTGLAGSVAVTGWVLDDIQVMRVTLCRDGVPGEGVVGEPAATGRPRSPSATPCSSTAPDRTWPPRFQPPRCLRAAGGAI